MRELTALLAQHPPETPTHRCVGCGHRWDGPLTGSEFCGDCHRIAVKAIHAEPPETAPTPYIPTPNGTVHDLKTWPDFFTSVMIGTKNFEVRKNDRGYKEGDTLRLREWFPETESYSGREVARLVTYVLDSKNWLHVGWIADGFVVLGLQPLAATASRGDASRAGRPKVICLCGSTRFIETFAVKTWELELEGHIVLGCTLLPQWYCEVPHHFAEQQGVKGQRDEHHLRKIDMADEVLVLNVGGYIGESTRNEIAYAERTGKPVSYLESQWAGADAPKETP